GDQHGHDDHVDFIRLLRDHIALRLLEALAHNLRGAADPGARLAVVDRHELSAHRLHLVTDFRPRVVRPHDRAKARGRADRGETRDACTDDEYLRRRYLARG